MKINKARQLLILSRVKRRLRKRMAELDRQGKYAEGTGIDSAIRIIQEEIDSCLKN